VLVALGRLKVSALVEVEMLKSVPVILVPKVNAGPLTPLMVVVAINKVDHAGVPPVMVSIWPLVPTGIASQLVLDAVTACK